MKKEKKGMLSVFAAVLALALAGVVMVVIHGQITQLTSGDLEPQKVYEYHFAMVVDGADAPYWELVYQGALQRAQEQNAYVELIGDNLSSEYSLEDRLRIAVDAKVDGIFVVPDGSQAVDTLIGEAVSQESGSIPVLTVMENDSSSARSGYVGINHYDQGMAYGRLIQTLCERREVSTVVLLTDEAQAGEDGSYSGGGIYSSLVEFLQEQGLMNQITLSVRPVDHSSVFSCKQEILSILREENAPDVLICPDYRTTLSSYQVAVEQNLVGSVSILGSYLSEEILSYIQKGTIYGTVTVDPNELAKLCVDGLIELCLTGRTSDYATPEMMTIDQTNAADYAGYYREEKE